MKEMLYTVWTLSPQKIWKNIHKGINCGVTPKEIKRIETIPPKTKAEITLRGRKLFILDSLSFIYMYNEILLREIYRFETEKKSPVIIDCGANIGLSVIYFKTIYPGAKIIAFEPDAEAFSALKANVESFNLADVDLYQLGVAAEEGISYFIPDNSDGGHFVNSPADSAVQCRTASLNSYLQGEVDILKLDIEGSETEVIESIQDKLHLVNKVFLEYHSFKNNPQDLDIILGILAKNGFRYFIQSVFDVKNPFNFRSNSGGMDMQLNIYACRI